MFIMIFTRCYLAVNASDDRYHLEIEAVDESQFRQFDLYVTYDSNKWLYPKQIVSGLLDVNPEKGNCKLESDGTRTFDSIQNILK